MFVFGHGIEIIIAKAYFYFGTYKVMRGLKRQETAILKGYQIYHNYLRPHEGLDNKTPDEACGIKIEGKNKWITLIENAKHTLHY